MLVMNWMNMIIMMFPHSASDLVLFCQLSTKDLLKKVMSEPLQEGTCQRHCRDMYTFQPFAILPLRGLYVVFFTVQGASWKRR